MITGSISELDAVASCEAARCLKPEQVDGFIPKPNEQKLGVLGSVSLMQWMDSIIVLTSIIAACLAWAAKLWWGREYSRAKDEAIRAKDSQIEALVREIETLRELTPMRIREYFLSVKQQLEEYNDSLRGQLEDAKRDLAQRDAVLESLAAGRDQHSEKAQRLIEERDALAHGVNALARRLAVNLENATENSAPSSDSSTVDYASFLDTVGYVYLIRALSPSARTRVDRQLFLNNVRNILIHSLTSEGPRDLPHQHLAELRQAIQGFLEKDGLKAPKPDEVEASNQNQVGEDP